MIRSRLTSFGLGGAVLVVVASCATTAPLAPAPTAATASAPTARVATANPTISSPAPTTATVTPPPAVDANAYKESPSGMVRYAFVSPSGAIHCAISDGKSGYPETGCQGDFVVPTLPKCDSPATNGPMVRFADGKVVAECTTQGLFMSEARKALPYGSSITAMGYTCTSQTAGLTCTKSSTGQFFTIAKEAITTKG